MYLFVRAPCRGTAAEWPVRPGAATATPDRARNLRHLDASEALPTAAANPATDVAEIDAAARTRCRRRDHRSLRAAHGILSGAVDSGLRSKLRGRSHVRAGCEAVTKREDAFRLDLLLSSRLVNVGNDRLLSQLEQLLWWLLLSEFRLG